MVLGFWQAQIQRIEEIGMITKLASRFLAELTAFLLNSAGLALLLFGAFWLGWEVWAVLRRRPTESLHRAPAALAALIGSSAFIYLSASTAARRAFINLPMYELGRNLGNVVVGAGLAGAVALSLLALARRLGAGSPRQQAGWLGVGVGLAYALALGGLYATTFQADLDEVTAAAPALAQIQVADQVPLQVFEDQVIHKPTALLVGPQGELYVAGLDGFIWVLRDTDQDGAADQVHEFAHGLQQPEGLALDAQGVYVTQLERLVRLTDTDGDGAADQTTTIVAGLPGENYAFHQPNSLVFGPDGRLYIGVGATTDHRPETHPLAARLLSVNPDGSDLRVYATGLRNPYAMILAPGGGFFAVDNGSSGCVDTAQQVDDCTAKIPVPEELNHIREGRDYGFPDYFGIPPQDSGTQPPVVTFPEHSAPAGLVRYTGDKLPAQYHGQLFVSLWARGEIHSVRVFQLAGGEYVGDSRVFVSGLIGPTALANAPDGGLYAASFSTNTIYRIGR